MRYLKKSLYILLLCITWYSFSVGTSLFGKRYLQLFPYPLTLTLSHFLSIMVLIPIITWVQGVRGIRNATSENRRTYYRRLLGLSVGKIFASVSSHISILRLPVSYTHTVKALMPVFTVFLSKLILNETHTRTIYLTLIPIISGVLLATMTEIFFDLGGIICAIISTGAFSLQNIYSKKVLHDIDIHQLQLLEHINLIALVFYLPIWFIIDGVTIFSGHAQFDWADLYYTVLCGLLSSLCNVGQNVFAFTVINAVTPLSYAVANVTKRLVIITGSILTFKDPISLLSGMGIAIAIVGVYLYNRAKLSSLEKMSKMDILPLSVYDTTNVVPSGDLETSLKGKTP